VLAQRVGEGDLDLLLGQLAFELQQNLSTTRRMMSLSSERKLTMASSRLRNSGVNSA